MPEKKQESVVVLNHHGLPLGHCVHQPQGWKFFPANVVNQESRKHWPTWEKCVPRWAKKAAVRAMPWSEWERQKNAGADAYYLETHNLTKIERVAKRLDDPASLSWDDRRDLANLLNLVLSEVRKLPVDEK